MADERDPTNNHAAGGPPPVGSSDAERLLQQAQWALESIDARSAPGDASDLSAFEYEELVGQPASGEDATLDVLSDVQLDLKIELGRADMHLEDVLKLRKGSVVPLNKLVSDPVDIYVNQRLVARGEVLVLNGNFCVRVVELIAETGPGG